jgi:hypothetical protein
MINTINFYKSLLKKKSRPHMPELIFNLQVKFLLLPLVIIYKFSKFSMGRGRLCCSLPAEFHWKASFLDIYVPCACGVLNLPSTPLSILQTRNQSGSGIKASLSLARAKVNTYIIYKFRSAAAAAALCAHSATHLVVTRHFQYNNELQWKLKQPIDI